MGVNRSQYTTDDGNYHSNSLHHSFLSHYIWYSLNWWDQPQTATMWLRGNSTDYISLTFLYLLLNIVGDQCNTFHWHFVTRSRTQHVALPKLHLMKQFLAELNKNFRGKLCSLHTLFGKHGRQLAGMRKTVGPLDLVAVLME